MILRLQQLPSREDLPVRGLEVITVLSIAVADNSAYCVAWSSIQYSVLSINIKKIIISAHLSEPA